MGTCTRRPIDKLCCVSGYFKAIKLKYKTQPRPSSSSSRSPNRGAIQFQLRTRSGKIILSHVRLTAKAIDLINLPAAFTESIRKYSLQIRSGKLMLTVGGLLMVGRRVRIHIWTHVCANAYLSELAHMYIHLYVVFMADIWMGIHL